MIPQMDRETFKQHMRAELEGILSIASSCEDLIREGGHGVAAGEAVAEIGVGADAELLAGLDQCGEDVHRPRAALAFAVQAHIAPARTDAGTQLRRVVVQGHFGM